MEEAKALIWVRESGGLKGAINNAVYRNLNGTDALEASNHLRRLRTLNILEIRKSGSQAYFVPGEVFREVHESWQQNQPAPPDKINDEGLTPPNRLMKGAKGGSLPPLAPPDSPELPPINPPLMPLIELSRAELLRALTPKLQQDLENLGERPARHTLRKFIVDLCATRPYRATEIALIMERSAAKLAARHLSPMVNEGKLARAYDKPSHPHQAYRAVALPSQTLPQNYE